MKLNFMDIGCEIIKCTKGKKVIVGLLLFFFLLSCSRPDPAEVAAHAAKRYYENLFDGNYEAFVDGQFRNDSIPNSYREQLITNAQMYVEQQKQIHRGVKDIKIVNVKADSLFHSANVFLVFTYGDSTKEEICVPMLENNRIWYLR